MSALWVQNGEEAEIDPRNQMETVATLVNVAALTDAENDGSYL